MGQRQLISAPSHVNDEFFRCHGWTHTWHWGISFWGIILVCSYLSSLQKNWWSDIYTLPVQWAYYLNDQVAWPSPYKGLLFSCWTACWVSVLIFSLKFHRIIDPLFKIFLLFNFVMFIAQLCSVLDACMISICDY